MLNHVTVHVMKGTFDRIDFNAFTMALGFEEIEPAESVPDGWRVRWFAGHDYLPGNQTVLHLVETDGKTGPEWWDVFSLGHICVSGVGRERYVGLMATTWCVRNSGSGRIWLEFANLRVEVRP